MLLLLFLLSLSILIKENSHSMACNGFCFQNSHQSTGPANQRILWLPSIPEIEPLFFFKRPGKKKGMNYCCLWYLVVHWRGQINCLCQEQHCIASKLCRLLELLCITWLPHWLMQTSALCWWDLHIYFGKKNSVHCCDDSQIGDAVRGNSKWEMQRCVSNFFSY